MAKKLNCPSESFLVPRQHRIKAIQELYNAVNEVSSGSGSGSGYATEQWVGQQGYLTQHQDISGKADKVAVVDHGTSDTTFALTANVFHKWGVVSSLTLTIASGAAGYLSEYMFEFQSGSTATSLSLPSTVTWVDTPTIEANKTYQVSIVNDIAIIVGV